MDDHYQGASEGVVSDADRELPELPQMTETERHKFPVECNNALGDYPMDKCVHELFEEQVEKTPESIAVIFQDEQLTYRALNTRANQLAHHLKRRGVGHGTYIGVYMERSPEAIIALLAAFKAGGVYVPLDPAYPKDRLLYMMKDCKAGALVTQKRHLTTFPEHNAITVCLDTEGKDIDSEITDNPLSGINADHLAYVIYTSGSTGAPKGVLIRHGAIAGHCFTIARYYELCPSDRVYQFASMSFDGSMEQIIPALITGAAVIPRDNNVWTPLDFTEKSAHLGLTVLCVPPAVLHEWARFLIEFPNHAPVHQPRMIICGGEELRSETIRMLSCTSMRYVRVLNVYGPTEATITATLFEIDLQSHESCLPQRIPIGRPSPNRTVYILDQLGNLLPAGLPGEIYIGGDFLAFGYLNRPDLTEEKFIPDPFSKKPGARLYKTGDLGRYLPDGNIEFIGRIDHQVKIRGFRIEPGEIEAVLGQHPAVLQTIVIAREDQPGEKRLVAYIVSREDTLNVSELRSHLSRQLPVYMIPSAFVMLNSLPLTANGKVDRSALPAPDCERPELEGVYAVPRNAVELKLAAIWTEVLGIQRVGVNDNFFDLGGDSLSAIRVMGRLQNFYGVELSPISMFEAPTIAGLAQLIADATVGPSGLKPPPVLSHSHSKNAPLSFGQQEIWLSTQLWPDVPVYNETFTVYMKGPIDAVALEHALNLILLRHDILRTAFITEEGKPAQSIQEEVKLRLRVDDLRSVPASSRETDALGRATEEARRPFDLGKPPLFRAMLAILDDSDCRLFLVFQHMVIDGVSVNHVFVPELWECYESIRKNRSASLPALPIQYRDFADWQRKTIHGPLLENGIAYWSKQLDGAIPLNIPTDRPRPLIQTVNGAFEPIIVPKELTRRLKALGRRQGCTLYMVLLAAFKVQLWRYSYQEEIVIGTIEAGRSLPELEPLMGYFLNMLVIRTDLSGDDTFKAFLERVRRVFLETYAHKDLPFTKLIEALKPSRDPSRHPLFQVAFVMEPHFPVHKSGWTVSQLDIQTGTAKFDLTLELDEREENIIGRFEYNSDLFDGATIRRMIGHFKTLLESIVGNPDQSLSELPFLTEIELHQSLVEWNDTTADYPVTSGIHVLFEAQVARTPDAIAIVFENENLTYAELNEQANKVAHYLRSIGVRQDTLVGIYMERSLEMMIGLLGILKAGGAYVPLDPSYPKDRLIFMLEDSQVPILLSQQQLVEKLPVLSAQVICLDTGWTDIAIQAGGNPESLGNPDDRAYVIYTSGSTGIPKGVEISHRSAINFLESMRRWPGLMNRDVMLAVTTLSFDIALLELFLPLIAGAKVLIVSHETASDGKELLGILAESNASVMQATPATWRLLLEAGWQGNDNLKILCGGEPLTRELASHLIKRCLSLWNMYGPTETTVWSTVCEVKSEEYISIGKPIANTRVYILDRNLQPVPVGVPGELHIGGAGLALGYLNLQQLTDEKFIADPFSSEPGKRIYKTGDLARYLPDGSIEHLGRLDYQVKVRGFRIELGEIEKVLGQHPAVEETVVIARETTSGENHLVAYLTVGGEKPSPYELRNFLKKKLPDYMVPLVFEIIEKFPLTPNGKINRKALPEPGGLHPELEDTYVAPCTPTEEIVADIWCEVLGLQKVGIHDNFFELGGHSLLATKVTSRLAGAFQLEMSLRDLFEKPTVAELALRVTQSQAHDIDPGEMERILNELEETASDPVSGARGFEDERDE